MFHPPGAEAAFVKEGSSNSTAASRGSARNLAASSGAVLPAMVQRTAVSVATCKKYRRIDGSADSPEFKRYVVASGDAVRVYNQGSGSMLRMLQRSTMLPHVDVSNASILTRVYGLYEISLLEMHSSYNTVYPLMRGPFIRG
jgi:hypothetical protein